MPEINLDRLKILIKEARKNKIVYTGNPTPQQSTPSVQQNKSPSPIPPQTPPRRGGCGCSRK